MSNDLLFKSGLNTSHPVDLRFGADDVLVVTYRNLTVSAVVPPPTASGFILAVRSLTISAVVPPPTVSSTLHYDNAVYRGPRGATKNLHQDSTSLQKQTQDKTQTNLPLHCLRSTAWEHPIARPALTVLPMQSAIPTRIKNLSPWAVGAGLRTRVINGFSSMIARPRPSIQLRHQVGVHVVIGANQHWQERYRKPRPALLSSWGLAIAKTVELKTLIGKAIAKPIHTSSGWQIGMQPPHGRHVPPVIPPIDERCYIPPGGGAVDLLFVEAFAYSTDILFSCTHYVSPPSAAVVIPIRSTYIVINTISLKRVSDNAAIPDVSLTMSIDMDSWTWGFSASLPASALSLVTPSIIGEPVLLEASINGTAYRFIAESIKRDRTFGKSTINVTGRGQSALLADPYSPVLSFDNSTANRTAQQLIGDALTDNGVPLPWSVEWHLDDWVVPTGAWTHRGSYMSAVTTIAAAAGGFVQPHPTAPTLLILPRNKVAPWNLSEASPDVEIPAAVIRQESLSWENRAEYDSVYVSGSSAGGVLGHVKRIGTPGSKAAPMVTDNLITDSIAARQRGIYELSKYGRVIKYQLNLPILPETGIIMPGKIVRYIDAGIPSTGMVDSVQVNVSLPSATQTITVTKYV